MNVAERVLLGRACLFASNGFPYAGGDVVEVKLEELEAVGLLSVWRSDRRQVLLRLEGEKLVLIQANEQSPTMQRWIKEALKNVRAREPSKEQAWTVVWKVLLRPT